MLPKYRFTNPIDDRDLQIYSPELINDDYVDYFQLPDVSDLIVNQKGNYYNLDWNYNTSLLTLLKMSDVKC